MSFSGLLEKISLFWGKRQRKKYPGPASIGIEKPNSGTIAWNERRYYPLEGVHMAGETQSYQAVFQDASGTLKPGSLRHHNVEEGPYAT